MRPRLGAQSTPRCHTSGSQNPEARWASACCCGSGLWIRETRSPSGHYPGMERAYPRLVSGPSRRLGTALVGRCALDRPRVSRFPANGQTEMDLEPFQRVDSRTRSHNGWTMFRFSVFFRVRWVQFGSLLSSGRLCLGMAGGCSYGAGGGLRGGILAVELGCGQARGRPVAADLPGGDLGRCGSDAHQSAEYVTSLVARHRGWSQRARCATGRSMSLRSSQSIRHGSTRTVAKRSPAAPAQWLREPVAGLAAAGGMQPAPVGASEPGGQAAAELGADVGHCRPGE